MYTSVAQMSKDFIRLLLCLPQGSRIPALPSSVERDLFVHGRRHRSESRDKDRTNHHSLRPHLSVRILSVCTRLPRFVRDSS